MKRRKTVRQKRTRSGNWLVRCCPGSKARITQETPQKATQWSTRTRAHEVGVSETTVRRVWRDNGLKPHRTKGLKISNDPRFAEKLVDVVGLYLDPPEHALVLSCDEKSRFRRWTKRKRACH